MEASESECKRTLSDLKPVTIIQKTKLNALSNYTIDMYQYNSVGGEF